MAKKLAFLATVLIMALLLARCGDELGFLTTECTPVEACYGCTVSLCMDITSCSWYRASVSNLNYEDYPSNRCAADSAELTVALRAARIACGCPNP